MNFKLCLKGFSWQNRLVLNWLLKLLWYSNKLAALTVLNSQSDSFSKQEFPAWSLTVLLCLTQTAAGEPGDNLSPEIAVKPAKVIIYS